MKMKIDFDKEIDSKYACIRDFCKDLHLLNFEDKPNYSRLKSYFLNVLQQYNSRDPMDIRPDWVIHRETMLN